MANQDDNKTILILEQLPVVKRKLVLLLQHDHGQETVIDFCKTEEELLEQINQKPYTEVIINVDCCSEYGLELMEKKIGEVTNAMVIHGLTEYAIDCLMILKRIKYVAGDTTSKPKNIE
jgi:ActR/RegA family two-component response regulator